VGVRSLLNLGLIGLVFLAISAQVSAQASAAAAARKQSSAGQAHKSTSSDSALDEGSVTNGVYRNKSLGLSYKIPDGWVLRTDEMNAEAETAGDLNSGDKDSHVSQKQRDMGHPSTGDNRNGRVLLAAFSRPPEAKGEDVNASIVIAAESVTMYPGLKEAAQYFGPLTEVTTAQGFTVDEEPYEVAVGSKTLVRGDFHKDVGSRVMRQSTLAFLARGYAISITVIGGTEDEVEELIDGIIFAGK